VKAFHFTLFPEAIVTIAWFLQGWINSVTYGRMDNVVVVVGMISSRPVLLMVELGVAMNWSQVEGGPGSLSLRSSSKRF